MSSHINELEEKLRQAEKLAYIGQMTSKLAHELRNPLNTISINLQLLEEDMETAKRTISPDHLAADKIDCDQLLRRIQISKHEIQRLEHLLSNFLRFAKSVPTQVQSTDINLTLRNLIEFIQPTATSSQVQIVIELQSELPLVNIDEKLLKSAILNLVLNAIEAMPNGGTLTIRTAVSLTNKKQVQILIRDTGIGISAENLLKVFDVFYTTKEDGSGLGLPIAKRIITDADGYIELSSEPGKGTTVIIKLPGI